MSKTGQLQPTVAGQRRRQSPERARGAPAAGSRLACRRRSMLPSSRCLRPRLRHAAVRQGRKFLMQIKHRLLEQPHAIEVRNRRDRHQLDQHR